MRTLHVIKCVMILVGVLAGGTCIAGVPASISYQGKLTNTSGQPVVDGAYSMVFTIYDAPSGGSLLWTENQPAVQVTGGLFTVRLGSVTPLLDSAFQGNSWLQTTVNGTPLTPMVQIVSAGYAIRAKLAETVPNASITAGSIAAGQVVKSVNGLKDDVTLSPGSNITITPSGQTLTISSTAGGLADGSVTTAKLANGAVTNAKVTDVAWGKLTGVPAGLADGDNDTTYSAGTGLALAGTTFSLSSAYTDSLYWKLGGNAGTAPGTNFIGTTDNQPLEFRVNNTRGFRLEPTSGAPNVIGGYSGNTVAALIAGATISGGGTSAGVNSVTGNHGTVGGGLGNTVSWDFATVVGGFRNAASGEAATVGGGSGNNAGGINATVGGGYVNTASGDYGTVPGGYGNTALGSYSFAAGSWARANHTGAFVWADSTGDFASTAANQFLIKASGGVGIGASDPAAALDVNGLIRSRAGGVKFPDGTIQTTALTASPWGLTGNAGTIPGTNFIGTTDDQPLDFRVNNTRGFRLEPTIGTPNVIGGYSGNTVAAGAYGATISGGGTNLFPNSVTNHYGAVGGGSLNSANVYGAVAGGNLNSAGDYASVGGGYGNAAGGEKATVGGGQLNTASGNYSTVGGGSDNTASYHNATVGGGSANSASGYIATVGGGQSNTASYDFGTVGGGELNIASGDHATVGGGLTNAAGGYIATVAGGYGNAASNYGTVGGGRNNNASGDWYATVSGGADNTAGNWYATVGGGSENTASGSGATVPGGFANTALGDYTFAAGSRAKANHTGTFVWSGFTAGDFASTAANQFLIRASGGVGINTNSPTNALSVAGNADVSGNVGIGTSALAFPLNFANTVGDKISLWGQGATHYGFGIQGYLLQIHSDGWESDIAFGYGSSGTMTETMRIKGTGNVGIGTSDPSYKLHVNGSVAGVGAYNQLSDLRYKTNISAIGNALDKVEKLRGVTFDWKRAEHPELGFDDRRQMGLIAQEVEKVLPEAVSRDDKGNYSVAYSTLVPLLVEAMKEQNARLDRLESENGSLQRQIDDLKKLVAALVGKEQDKP